MKIFQMPILGLMQIVRTIVSVYKHGFTLLALLDSVKSKKGAFIEDDYEHVSYWELYHKSVSLAYLLNKKHNITYKSKVVIVSSNSIALTKSIFAVSGLGADIFLLNPNQNKEYYNDFLATQKIDLIAGEASLADCFKLNKIPFFNFEDISKLKEVKHAKTIIRRKKGNIIILSSGSKGKPTTEIRKLSPIKFLNPLTVIIQKLSLKEYASVLISVPVFHGYGLAALFLSVFLGKKIYVSHKFDAQKTSLLIESKKIESWIVVPLMIQKVFSLPGIRLNKLKCIISGGDILSTNTIDIIRKKSHAKIYNMYGTSQTGVCTIATDADLTQFPHTIGQTITGVETKILDASDNTVPFNTAGTLFVKCSWSSDDEKNNYVSTGDIVFKNEQGFYFYKCRQDDLIIIGGENIYPLEIENIICQNNMIAWVKAKAVNSNNCITLIHIDIVLHPDIDFSLVEFTEWIKNNVPNYMIPKSLSVLDAVPDAKLM